MEIQGTVGGAKTERDTKMRDAKVKITATHHHRRRYRPTLPP